MSAFANFPYELVETTGENALATWEELKNAGRGAPVVLGDEPENLLFPFDPLHPARLKPVEAILSDAEAINFPNDLRKLRRAQYAQAMVSLGMVASPADFVETEDETPSDDWLAETSDAPGLSVAYERTGEPKSAVHIALIPTVDATAIPAYLRFGDWNACPSPAYHVAALRAWRDLYGAELIGLSFDTINLRVSRKPATREEALELARAQFVYCSDIIVQGVGSYGRLAAGLMESDWWYFWWD
jgi:hypothetical protein